MKWWMSIVIIPIVTVILTKFVDYFKDLLQNKENAKKQVKEQQLLELYNSLFIIYLKYNRFLKIDWDIEEINTENDYFINRHLEIKEPEVWNEAIDQVTKLIQSKIHLLEHRDLKIWYEVEQLLYIVNSEEDLFDAYSAFKKFIKSTVNTYGNLYHDYHLVLNTKKKEKIKELKKEINNIKKNPFYTKKEKKQKINRIEGEIKSLKKFGFKGSK